MLDTGERIKFLKRVLGDCEIARDGVNIAFSCPNCKSDKAKKKLAIKIDTGQWHCWVCEIKGKTIPSLLRKYARPMYPEWLQTFENRDVRNIYVDDNVPAKEALELPDGLNIDELNRSSDPDAMAILTYLYKRGIDEDVAYRYRLSGITTGRYRRRVLIPSFDGAGELNYWTARSIDKDTRLRYVNPKIDRKSIIFNEVDIDWKKEITLVEGPFDLMKAGNNAVCLLGSTLPYDSLLFKRIIENKTDVIIALDSDAIVKSHKIAKTLYQYNIGVKFIELKGSEDIGDMNANEFIDLKKRAYSWNPIDRLTHKISGISSGSLI